MNISLLSRTTAVALAAAAFTAPVAGADDHFKDPHRAVAHGVETVAPEMVVVPATRPAPAVDDSIEWTDAAIGAGGVIGLTLVFVGGTLLAVNRRRLRY
jgi:hypothetical protein